MNFPSVNETAVARWISGGVTSLSHPILAVLQAECFGVIGIEADWFEAEPFSSLEAGLTDGWLRSPRWRWAGVDRNHPAAADLCAWASRSAEIAVSADGLFRLPGAGAEGPDAWAAVRHSVIARSRASTFLCAAAGALLFDAELAAIYLAGHDGEFVGSIWARLDSSRSERDKSEAARAHRTVPDEPAPAAE